MNRWSKWFVSLLVLSGFVGILGWQGWRWWIWANAPVAAAEGRTDLPPEPDPLLNAESHEVNAVDIAIKDGTSAQQIGEKLADSGLIRSEMAWSLWTRWQNLQDRPGGFLAGTYRISPTESMVAIANRIWEGDVVQNSITIPEGWAIADIAAYLESEDITTAETFVAATEAISRADYPWLPTEIFSQGKANLEGFLFPDTYQIIDSATPEQVVEQMLSRFEALAGPLYDASNSPYSFLEWVTLASIVEKEAVISEERPEIAAVFARRLREGIPLGADPTVEYALDIQQTPENPLTLSDIRTPSPYNTYRYAGLPPGPIASPGAASLEVSLDPPDTEYLYFVARYDGTHVFSRTLAEHEAAQAEIRKAIEAQ